MSDPAVEGAGTGPKTRFELKFVAPQSQFDDLLLWVRLHGLAFREVYAPRQVHNLYLDTPDLACYYQNLAGVSHREKVRIRWYGAADLPDEATLEVKHKRGMQGWKETWPLTGLPGSATTDWRGFLAAAWSSLPAPVLARFDSVRCPTLINGYRRRYFATPDRRLRLTIDRDLTAFEQIRRARPNLGAASMFPEVCVLELKAPPDEEDRLRRAAQGIPLRVSRFSKYCVALQNFLAPGGGRIATPH